MMLPVVTVTINEKYFELYDGILHIINEISAVAIRTTPPVAAEPSSLGRVKALYRD